MCTWQIQFYSDVETHDIDSHGTLLAISSGITPALSWFPGSKVASKTLWRRSGFLSISCICWYIRHKSARSASKSEHSGNVLFYD